MLTLHVMKDHSGREHATSGRMYSEMSMPALSETGVYGKWEQVGLQSRLVQKICVKLRLLIRLQPRLRHSYPNPNRSCLAWPPLSIGFPGGDESR